MAAMRAEDDIALSQMGTDADGDRLFADIGVTGSVHEPALVRSGKLLFALPDDLHIAVQLEQCLLIDIGRERRRHIESGLILSCGHTNPKRQRGSALTRSFAHRVSVIRNRKEY
jgi:hypothetical protein